MGYLKVGWPCVGGCGGNNGLFLPFYLDCSDKDNGDGVDRRPIAIVAKYEGDSSFKRSWQNKSSTSKFGICLRNRGGGGWLDQVCCVVLFVIYLMRRVPLPYRNLLHLILALLR